MSLPEGTPGNRKVSRVVAFLVMVVVAVLMVVVMVVVMVMVVVAVLLGQLNTEAAEMDGIWGKVNSNLKFKFNSKVRVLIKLKYFDGTGYESLTGSTF